MHYGNTGLIYIWNLCNRLYQFKYPSVDTCTCILLYVIYFTFIRDVHYIFTNHLCKSYDKLFLKSYCIVITGVFSLKSCVKIFFSLRVGIGTLLKTSTLICCLMSKLSICVCRYADCAWHVLQWISRKHIECTNMTLYGLHNNIILK